MADFHRPRTALRPGTLLTREWDGHLQQVMVLADGFSWNGKTYPSLSRVAYLLFLYFADAPDVPNPCTEQQWQGAQRLTEKCLGLGAHRFRKSVGTLIWSIP